MSLKQVFNVVVNFEPLLPHQWGERFTAVEKDIIALSGLEKEKVTFHAFVDEDLLGGGPSLLVEMSQAFANKVRRLEHVSDIATPHLPTQPRPIQP